MPGTADDLSGQGIEPEADGRRRQINGVDGTQCLTWNGGLTRLAAPHVSFAEPSGLLRDLAGDTIICAAGSQWHGRSLSR